MTILNAMDETVGLDRAASVVIVGAGPAGLTLAQELGRSTDVLVVESGGAEHDWRVEALRRGEVVGLDYPLGTTGTRRFGGSTSLWAGYCARFDPIDFTARSWVRWSGWPFGEDELKRFYRRAAELLNLGRASFDAGEVAARAGLAFPFECDALVPTVWRFGCPILRIAEQRLAEFETAPNVTALTNASVVDIRLDKEHREALAISVRTLGGRSGTITADLFVLACGGLETPRLLLNADSQLPGGVGNAAGQVGRCFMEHPHVPLSGLTLRDGLDLPGWADRMPLDDGRDFLFCLGLSKEAQRDHEILNARAHVYRTPDMAPDATPKVGLFMEQEPNPSSRVTLGREADGLGMRRIRLDWRLSELDHKSAETASVLFGRAFARAGLASFSEEACRAVAEPDLLHSNHQLGTTRMSDDPRLGVVDRDCRVHGHDNLYLIGGGIFPTVSWANPTFTLIALTLRLAEHLAVRLGGPAKGFPAPPH